LRGPTFSGAARVQSGRLMADPGSRCRIRHGRGRRMFLATRAHRRPQRPHRVAGAAPRGRAAISTAHSVILRVRPYAETDREAVAHVVEGRHFDDVEDVVVVEADGT